MIGDLAGCAPDSVALARWYIEAKRSVFDAGYLDEVVWQSGRRLELLTNAVFLREAAWVVLAAGMADRVVRAVFPAFERAMCDFVPAVLVENRAVAEGRALKVFGHRAKVRAVLDIAEVAESMGPASLTRRLENAPEEFLRSLPYVGPVTWKHLAKNLGVQTAKSDRHLVRLAQQLGRPSVDALCVEIAGHVGDPVSVVDVVLWRWCVESSGGRASLRPLGPEGPPVGPAGQVAVLGDAALRTLDQAAGRTPCRAAS